VFLEFHLGIHIYFPESVTSQTSVPISWQAKMRLTKIGFGRLSFSQISGREIPKSCPGTGDVGDTGKLSR
jgi:hypothetical protein